MRAPYRVQRLAGYVDGSPSWERVDIDARHTWSREAATAEKERLEREQPGRKFRVRKVTRK